MFRLYRPTFIAILVILVAGGLAAACTGTGDLEKRIEALERQQADATLAGEVTALREQVVRASLVATLNLLDDVGFHELNETIRDTGEAPAGANGSIRIALRAVAVTGWPDDLEPAATEFQDDLQRFFDALRGDDPAAPVDPSQKAHDTYHAFTGDAWNYLAESVGFVDITEEEHGHE